MEPAAVENDLSDFDVMEPGSKPPRVMATLPGGTVPAYVRLVAFWLERSLQFYTSPPFSMRNPAANGRLSVCHQLRRFRLGESRRAFFINNALPARSRLRGCGPRAVPHGAVRRTTGRGPGATA